MNRMKYENYKQIIDDALDGYIACQVSALSEAMRYSALADGKRARPVLVLAACEAVGGDIQNALPYACAIEMIHCYSLIHDDLPCMDNDEYRRGRKTNHMVFGEAMAMLAGDGLLNMAYEIMSQACLNASKKGTCENHLRAMNKVATSAGVHGMVGGQVVDIESTNKNITDDELLYMYEHKTADMIKASVSAGALVGGAENETIRILEEAVGKIGIAFQIKDDLLDITGDFAKLGKTASDERNNKSTYVAKFGAEKSKEECERLQNEAAALLNRAGVSDSFLAEFIDWLANRDM